jgi:hypothetical protein
VAPLAAPPLAAPVAVEAFAAPPRLTAVNISPDGRYLAVITTAADRDTAVILERSQPNLPLRPVLTAPEFFTLDYCRFATPTRLVCSLRGPGMYQGIAIPTSRLIAVDADGTNQKVIAPIEGAALGPYQDSVIGWSAEVPDTILVIAQRNPVRFDMPSAVKGVRESHMGSTVVVNATVFGLNIRNGNLTEQLPPRRPLSGFLVDAAGTVRLGWGMNDGSRQLHCRPCGVCNWAQVQSRWILPLPMSTLPGRCSDPAVSSSGRLRNRQTEGSLHGCRHPADD